MESSADNNLQPQTPSSGSPQIQTQISSEPTISPELNTNPSPEPPASLPEPQKPQKIRKPLIIVLVVLLLATAGISGFAWYNLANSHDPTQDTQSPDPTEPTGLTEYDLGKLSDFDLSFLRLETINDNVIYSPLSIKYALAMLSDAASGESKTQITSLIGDYQPNKYTNNEHRAFANAMFIRDVKKDQVLSSYTDTLKQKYNASVIFDPFASSDSFNNWINDQTMGIIDNMLDDNIDSATDFILINALAIDMNWNNQLQCAHSETTEVPCQFYYVRPAHENYHESIQDASAGFSQIIFNENDVDAAEIGTTANRYDIINELGEDTIRATVLDAYEKWKIEENEGEEDEDFNIDKYMEELGKNYSDIKNSTDFYFFDTDDEKVFAKDLQKYDGSTLQYIGIMPKEKELGSYISTMTAEKLTEAISNMKDASKIDNYKDGVITKIKGYIPFFSFNYELKLKDDLNELGITDVFDEEISDLSNMTSLEHSYIKNALHKADIDFSNDGIRAAAATVVTGGLGSAGSFDYSWEVPVEEIDITFDHPFLFIIRDKTSGEVWFTGTVYNPAS